MEKQTAIIYTDGSALGNPGPGGYGTVIEVTSSEGEIIGGEPTLLSGGEPHTTNNRMEMLAVIEGLYWLHANFPEIKTCTVVSDSRLVIETITSGWKRKKNVDLWEALDAQIQNFAKIKWEWVKGHAGHKQNTIADKLANGEATKQKKNLTKKSGATNAPLSSSEQEIYATDLSKYLNNNLHPERLF